jgi:hypothetical protein
MCVSDRGERGELCGRRSTQLGLAKIREPRPLRGESSRLKRLVADSRARDECLNVTRFISIEDVCANNEKSQQQRTSEAANL